MKGENLANRNIMSLKGDNFKNPFLSYLNINGLRYKFVDLRQILEQTGIEIVAVSESKLSEEFPDSQFFIDGYMFPAYRRDRNNHGSGSIVFYYERSFYKTNERSRIY